MKSYFNRFDREQHVLMMVFYYITQEWLTRCKSITAEERRFIKTGLTWLKKGYEGMIVRSSDEYIKSLKNTAKHSDLFLEDHTGKIASQKVDTKTLILEDFYDLSEHALVACQGCKKCDHQSCKTYHLFMRLGIPAFEAETDGCPYAQPVYVQPAGVDK